MRRINDSFKPQGLFDTIFNAPFNYSPTLDTTRILSFSVKVNFVGEIFYNNFYELEIRLKDC